MSDDVKYRRFEFDVIGDYDGELVEDGVIALHPKVIEVVDNEWRAALYDLNTPEEIAEHIAFNLMVNRWKLDRLDGWADLPASYARIEQGSHWTVLHYFDECEEDDEHGGEDYAIVSNVHEITE